MASATTLRSESATRPALGQLLLGLIGPVLWLWYARPFLSDGTEGSFLWYQMAFEGFALLVFWENAFARRSDSTVAMPLTSILLFLGHAHFAIEYQRHLVWDIGTWLVAIVLPLAIFWGQIRVWRSPEARDIQGELDGLRPRSYEMIIAMIGPWLCLTLGNTQTWLPMYALAIVLTLAVASTWLRSEPSLITAPLLCLGFWVAMAFGLIPTIIASLSLGFLQPLLLTILLLPLLIGWTYWRGMLRTGRTSWRVASGEQKLTAIALSVVIAGGAILSGFLLQ